MGRSQSRSYVCMQPLDPNFCNRPAPPKATRRYLLPCAAYGPSSVPHLGARRGPFWLHKHRFAAALQRPRHPQDRGHRRGPDNPSSRRRGLPRAIQGSRLAGTSSSAVAIRCSSDRCLSVTVPGPAGHPFGRIADNILAVASRVRVGAAPEAATARRITATRRRYRSIWGTGVSLRSW